MKFKLVGGDVRGEHMQKIVNVNGDCKPQLYYMADIGGNRAFDRRLQVDTAGSA